MIDWSIHIETRGGHPTDTAIDAFLDKLIPHAGVVAGDAEHDGYSARLSVEEFGPTEAVVIALAIFRDAAASAGLPDLPVVRVEALTHEELGRELAEPAFPELVGVAEIAEILGVTPQRASEVQTRTGFPAPVARLKSGPVWKRSSIGNFLETWERKPGRPRKVAS